MINLYKKFLDWIPVGSIYMRSMNINILQWSKWLGCGMKVRVVRYRKMWWRVKLFFIGHELSYMQESQRERSSINSSMCLWNTNTPQRKLFCIRVMVTRSMTLLLFERYFCLLLVVTFRNISAIKWQDIVVQLQILTCCWTSMPFATRNLLCAKLSPIWVFMSEDVFNLQR